MDRSRRAPFLPLRSPRAFGKWDQKRAVCSASSFTFLRFLVCFWVPSSFSLARFFRGSPLSSKSTITGLNNGISRSEMCSPAFWSSRSKNFRSVRSTRIWPTRSLARGRARMALAAFPKHSRAFSEFPTKCSVISSCKRFLWRCKSTNHRKSCIFCPDVFILEINAGEGHNTTEP